MRNADGNRTDVAGARTILPELGRQTMVDGQENVITDVVLDLGKERDQSAA